MVSSAQPASSSGSQRAPAPLWRLVVLWATGSDTSLDGVFRVQALRRTEAGAGDGADGGSAWERFDRLCNPFPDSERSGATARMLREYGVSGADLDGVPDAAQVFGQLAAFLDGGPVLTVDARGFEAWYARLVGSRPEQVVLGLDELGALMLPGRNVGGVEPRTPDELEHALAQLTGRFLELDRTTRNLAGAGFAAAFAGLVESDPEGARRFELALEVIERPSGWAGGSGELFALHPGLKDGRLPLPEDAAEPLGGAARIAHAAIHRLAPRCAEIAKEWATYDTVSVDLDPDRGRELAPGEEPPPTPLSAAGRGQLDDAFQVHLARAFETRGPEASDGYRPGQHDVAREVAATLGSRELLLVHAPTGTGKTLAYLVPALLWATENEVRIGVSTYTRALQEQAMDREVPRALEALRAAGSTAQPRVTLLKGRANYLCWRALCLHAPSEHDEPATWLAWTALALFARTDPDGDLDRFPQRTALLARTQRDGRGTRQGDYRRELNALVRAVRAGKGCCSASIDRRTCAAETARFRAERSHLVITNHSFALARQSFFKRIVFDECEHLHDQAHAAFSHTVSTQGIRDLLERLSQPGRPTSRAPLDRLERVVPPGGRAAETLAHAKASWYASWGQLDRLEQAIASFKEWRARTSRERDRRDSHSLLREYVAAAEEDGTADAAEALELIRARLDLHKAATLLESSLAQLAEDLDAVPARGMPRVRRALELVRTDLADVIDVLEAWIPLDGDEGPEPGASKVRFRRETFHEIEEDPRGRDVLAARVLLPNEFLGRFYYPQLSSAVLISATTWLRGGFDCARAYLGLDRAAEPDTNEDREPCSVRTFRAPDPFDWGRVLVCVPDDAPEYRDKRAFDEYVRTFISHLGERTRGRMLVLFTNVEDARRTGQELSGFFRARRTPLWFQNMPGHGKEELGELFRERVDSILLGVDTFWFGADFPGETLEYLVIVKLPYGVPDAYHQAQCAVLGTGEQRKRIYMPRALAKLRQGFGRLMRRESDRGCVFILDGRAGQPRHAAFLRELPLTAGVADLPGAEDREWIDGGARLLRASTASCIREALAHMSMLADVERRGLDAAFPLELTPSPPRRPPARQPGERRGRGGPPDRLGERPEVGRGPAGGRAATRSERGSSEGEILDIPTNDLPY